MDLTLNLRLCVLACLCLAGTEARLLLLPGSLLPWSLAVHAVGLLGCELRPLSGGEVNSARTRHRCQSAENKKCIKNARVRLRVIQEGMQFSPQSRLMRQYSHRGTLMPTVGPWRHTDTCWSVK